MGTSHPAVVTETLLLHQFPPCQPCYHYEANNPSLCHIFFGECRDCHIQPAIAMELHMRQIKLINWGSPPCSALYQSSRLQSGEGARAERVQDDLLLPRK